MMGDYLNEFARKLAEQVAQQEEDLIMEALKQNNCKVTHPATLVKRLKIQVDFQNKNKRVLLDDKLILIMSTNYEFEQVGDEAKVKFLYKIIK